MSRHLVAVLLLVTTASARAATIATDTETTTIATAPAATNPAPTDEAEIDEPAPRDIVLGIVSIDTLVSSRNGERHIGARIGMDVIGASGEGSIRLAGGIRLLLGGVSGFGPEGQLALGVAHAINHRAVVALVAPLGFAFAGPDFSIHGYAGIAGVAALGARGRGGGFERVGVELATEISNRGARARVGVVKPGKDIGVSIGLQWQRDGDADLFGIFLAETAGR